MKTKRVWTISAMMIVMAATMIISVVPMTSNSQMLATEGYSVSFLTFARPVNGLKVEGDYAYLASGDQMVIVDVSNPLVPVELGKTERLLAPPGSWQEDWRCGGIVYDVAVSDNYAYVAADTGGIQIVDVSDPLSPRLVGDDAHIGSIGIIIQGVVLVEAQNICMRGTNGGLVRIYDLTNPVTPLEIGSAFHAGYNNFVTSLVTVSGNYAYGAAASGSTLEIVSIEDPSEHYSYSQLDWPNWPDGFTPVSLLAYEHYLYVSADVRVGDPLLVIFDIKDPVEPVWVNEIDKAAGGSMAIDEGKLYVASGSTIDAYDLTDPTNPELLFSHVLSVDGFIQDIDAQDNCVYVGTYPSGFYVFCTNDPVVTPTPSLTPTSTSSLTPAQTPSQTPTSTVTPTATNTATPIAPLTPTATPSPSPTGAVAQRLYLPLIRSDGS